jgi:hypothetical protein
MSSMGFDPRTQAKALPTELKEVSWFGHNHSPLIALVETSFSSVGRALAWVLGSNPIEDIIFLEIKYALPYHYLQLNVYPVITSTSAL